MNSIQKIELSITKKFRKEIWLKFIKGIKEYELIKSGDKIAVCISGGKDSMLMAKLVQMLQRHSDVPFEAEYLVMDPGYSSDNRLRIIKNAEFFGIPIKIFNTQIYDIVAEISDSPCYLCARMRRGYLYKNAQDLGCNKIALGHHFDDVIETILMSMLYGAEIKTMMPKLHSTNFNGMELIRPMYMVKEASIVNWQRYNQLEFIKCACRLTEGNFPDGSGIGSKRLEMKALIEKFRQTNENIDMNIFRSVHNINLETIIGYRKNGISHNFIEYYDKVTGQM